MYADIIEQEPINPDNNSTEIKDYLSDNNVDITIPHNHFTDIINTS